MTLVKHWGGSRGIDEFNQPYLSLSLKYLVNNPALAFSPFMPALLLWCSSECVLYVILTSEPTAGFDSILADSEKDLKRHDQFRGHLISSQAQMQIFALPISENPQMTSTCLLAYFVEWDEVCKSKQPFGKIKRPTIFLKAARIFDMCRFCLNGKNVHNIYFTTELDTNCKESCMSFW